MCGHPAFAVGKGQLGLCWSARRFQRVSACLCSWESKALWEAIIKNPIMRYFLPGSVPWLEAFPVDTDTTVRSDARLLRRHIVLQIHHRPLLIVLF